MERTSRSLQGTLSSACAVNASTEKSKTLTDDILM
jgi:hypothetical protein